SNRTTLIIRDPEAEPRNSRCTKMLMLAAQDVVARCKELGVTALHIKLRATGELVVLRMSLLFPPTSLVERVEEEEGGCRFAVLCSDPAFLIIYTGGNVGSTNWVFKAFRMDDFRGWQRHTRKLGGGDVKLVIFRWRLCCFNGSAIAFEDLLLMFCSWYFW
ncbi:hypothetical protein MKW98_017057, partial [Papaver atlanticum]